MNPRTIPGTGPYMVAVSNGTPSRPVLQRFRTRTRAMQYIGERREYWLSQSLPDLTITERPDQSEIVVEQVHPEFDERYNPATAPRTVVAVYTLFTLK